ncbi:putative protein SERAC1 [Rosellinia necatrix]|uniref:NB-ARC domain-containing protein n=1 Tax=Rosellinia necatrix TaxID=77044 RepID=A0A1W2TKA6_ROSNE|nr:putative protein SERAC1 [Rosellinia necatrix]
MGDRISTWSSTSDSGFWWPQDIQTRANARVLMYGYSASAPTAEYLAQRTLHHHAEHLLALLADVRAKNPRRPLIFVAHSLGGILVKSALIFAKHAGDDSSSSTIAHCTVGIVFLGTPPKVHQHLSSSVGSALGRIASTGRLNRSILRSLERESKDLQVALEPFEAMKNDIDIVSFFESRDTVSIDKVVPTSGLPELQLFLDCNHVELAKFRGPDDDCYLLVYSAIRRLSASAASRVEKSWRKATKNDSASPRLLPSPRRDVWINKAVTAFTLPFPQNPMFVGRKEPLKWVADCLLANCPLDCPENCHKINLYGPAGVGKTQIALEFAYRFHHRFSSILWIPAQSRATAEQAFVEMTHSLDIFTANHTDARVVRGSIDSSLEWLSKSDNGDWLLIFDDVDISAVPEALEMIPSTACTHGNVIITSRDPLNLPLAKQPYMVDYLRLDESAELLQSHLGPSDADNTELEILASTLGGLPLALSTAAKYMRRSGMSPKTFLKSCKLEEPKGRPQLSHMRAFDAVFAESLDGVSPPAKLLLSMCSMVSSRLIPLWVFEECSGPFSPPRALRECLSTLRYRALIRQQPTQPYIVVDRMLRDYGRRYFPREVQVRAGRELCETASYVAETLANTGAKCLTHVSSSSEGFEKELVEVIVDVLPILSSYPEEASGWAVNLEELGKVCQVHGRLSEAIRFYQLHLDMNKGPAKTSMRVKLRLTLIRPHETDAPEADTTPEHVTRETHLRVFSDAVKAGDDQDSLQKIIELSCKQGDPEQHLEVLRMVIEAQEARLGPVHPLTIASIDEIVRRLIDQGLLDEAESWLGRILLSCRRELNTDNNLPSISCTVERLASVCTSLGKLEKAEAMCKGAINEYGTRLGHEHASTQRCSSQLAYIYHLQGRYAEAEPLFINAINTLTRTAGPNHPDVLGTKQRYAINLARAGRLLESIELLADVLSRIEAHPDVYAISRRREVAIDFISGSKASPKIANYDKWREMSRQLRREYDIED